MSAPASEPSRIRPAELCRNGPLVRVRTLAQVRAEVTVALDGPITQRWVLDSLETRYAMLRGTIRDHVTHKRRPLLRFFACEEDLSHESPDAPLPDAVAAGAEPFWIVGAIAGGL